MNLRTAISYLSRFKNRWNLLALLSVLGAGLALKLGLVFNSETKKRKKRIDEFLRKREEVKVSLQRCIAYTLNLKLYKDLPLLSLTQIRQMLDKGDVTVPELVVVCAQRLKNEAWDRHLISDVDLAGCLEQAEILQHEINSGKVRSPLHGIPFSVHESIACKGMIKRDMGQTIVIDPRDSLLVSILKENGAIVLCKGAMSLWGEHPLIERPVNPQNNQRTIEGSSGPDAAMVKLGCVVAAIGSELIEGLRYASMCCGVCALRPTSSRISGKAPGAKFGFPGLESSWGPIAKSSEDLSTIMDVLCRQRMHALDPRIPPVVWKECEPRKWKIGYIESDEFWPAPAPFQRVMKEVCQKLKSEGHTVVKVKFPPLIEALEHAAAMLFSNMKAFAGLSKFRKSMLMPKSLRNYYTIFQEKLHGEKESFYAKVVRDKSAYSYSQHCMGATRFKEQVLEAWEDLDGVLLPYHCPAPYPGMQQDLFPGMIYTALAALIDFPCANLALGSINQEEQFYWEGKGKWVTVMNKCMENSEGLPLGIQVMCLPFREEQLLQIMQTIENLFPK